MGGVFLKFKAYIFLILIVLFFSSVAVFRKTTEPVSPSASVNIPEPKTTNPEIPPLVLSSVTLRGASAARAHSQASTSVPAQERKLIDNWNLEGTGLVPEEVAPFMNESQPDSIIFFSEQGLQRIYPEHIEEGLLQSAQTLYIGSQTTIEKTKAERREGSTRYFSNPVVKESQTEDKKLTPLPKSAYEIVFFKPGLRDNGETLKPVNNDYLAAIQGPDYSLENFNYRDDNIMRMHLSRVLSFGKGGELLLKVKDKGFIVDEPGFDFAVYENALPVSTKNIYQEFGYVGVSESSDPQSFRWFPCDPSNGVLRGCVGAVPTDQGGDEFNLAELGVEKIRYIWIKDTGKNKNMSSKWPTDGLDLDALRLENAYIEE